MKQLSNEYEVMIDPDGNWSVTLIRRERAEGKAAGKEASMMEAEAAARLWVA